MGEFPGALDQRQTGHSPTGHQRGSSARALDELLSPRCLERVRQLSKLSKGQLSRRGFDCKGHPKVQFSRPKADAAQGRFRMEITNIAMAAATVNNPAACVEIRLRFEETGDLGSEPIVSSLHDFRFETGGDLNRFHGSTTGLDALDHVESCSMRSTIC